MKTDKTDIILKLIELFLAAEEEGNRGVNSREFHDSITDYAVDSLTEHPLIGEYIIVRSRDAGVHCGILVSVNGDTVMLNDSRRLWFWRSQKEMSLSGVARTGINQEESKICGPLSRCHTILNACELIPFASKEALLTIQSAGVYCEQ